jgi:hypothetical protein
MSLSFQITDQVTQHQQAKDLKEDEAIQVYEQIELPVKDQHARALLVVGVITITNLVFNLDLQDVKVAQQ